MLRKYQFIRWFFGVLSLACVMLYSQAVVSGELSARQIENYIKTLEEFVANEDKYAFLNNDEEDEYSLEEANSGLPKVKDMLERSRNHPSFHTFVAMLKRHGFKDLDEWADVTDRVMAASIFLSLDISRQQMQNSLDEMEREFDKMEGLTNEQRESMKQLALSQMTMMSAWIFNVPEADVEAVRPYMPRITALMSAHDDEEMDFSY